jgi:hypothetical protein
MRLLTKAQRTLLEKAADHPAGRITGARGIGRLALLNVGLIEKDGQHYSSEGGHPLYKITAKGRAAVKGPMLTRLAKKERGKR